MSTCKTPSSTPLQFYKDRNLKTEHNVPNNFFQETDQMFLKLCFNFEKIDFEEVPSLLKMAITGTFARK